MPQQVTVEDLGPSLQVEDLGPSKLSEVHQRLEATRARLKQKPPEPVRDALIGVGQGALSTIGNLGEMARKIPGVSALDKLMSPYHIDITPENT